MYVYHDPIQRDNALNIQSAHAIREDVRDNSLNLQSAHAIREDFLDIFIYNAVVSH